MKRIAITLFALILTVAAYAQPRPGQRPHGRGPGGPGPGAAPSPEKLAEILGLTAAQQAQFESMRATLDSMIEPLREQQQAYRESIKAAVDANDANAAGTALLASHRLREQIKAAHDAFTASFAAILTAEQKAKWETLRQMREHRRPHGRGEE